MKQIILTLTILILISINTFAQKYKDYLDSAELKFSQEKYFDAYEFYKAAKVYGKTIPSIVAKSEAGMEEAIVAIKKQKEISDSLVIVANNALIKAETALAKAELMQTKVEAELFNNAVLEYYSGWQGVIGIKNGYIFENHNQWSQIKYLDFYYSGLPQLPKYISYCDNLIKLNFIGNELRPEDWNELEYCTKLTEILLTDPNFDSIPEKYWSKIRGIELRNKGIEDIPENILKQLHYLEFRPSKNQSFQDIYKIDNLLELVIDYNYLEENGLTDEIKKFKNLRKFHIITDEIDSLPSELFSLSNLEDFSIETYSFYQIPKEIANLQNLKKLSLKASFKETEIEHLNEIGNLKKLEILEIAGCWYGDFVIPEEFGNLTELKVLNILGNEYLKIPKSFSKLKNLKFLGVNSSLCNVEDIISIGFNINNNISVENPTMQGAYFNYSYYLNRNDLTLVITNTVEYNYSFSWKYMDFNDIDLSNIDEISEKMLENLFSSKQVEDVYTLDLKFKSIDKIPANITNFRNVESLDLEGNELTNLHSEIGILTNLTSLYLSGNQLTDLPAEIGNLTSLKSLELWDNQLTELPKEIGNFTNLTDLVLSNNQLAELPKEIGNLTNLTELALWNNQLTELPKEIGNLTNLTSLGLYNNQLTLLPIEIGNLINLTELDLRKNKLTILPDFGKMNNLNKLRLGNNQLTSLPEEIGKLSNLTYLDLSGNDSLDIASVFNAFENFNKEILILSYDTENYDKDKLTIVLPNNLTILPIEIEKLTNITELDLGNQLTTLPAEIGKLTNLKVLDLNGNQIPTLPMNVGNLINLTSLDLSVNKLTSLPVETGKLTNLTSLNLGGNNSLDIASVFNAFENYNREIIISTFWNVSNNDKNKLLIRLPELTELPVEIGNLSSLTELDLRNNDLTKLPAEIGNLTNLTTMGLSGNKLTELPAEIGNLTNLTTMGLSGNKLTELPEEIRNLTNLTELYLGANDSLNIVSVFEVFKDYKKEICISTNYHSIFDENKLQINLDKFTSLPVEIGNLTNLTWLDLENNKLTDLPKEIGLLYNLDSLFLKYNNLQFSDIIYIQKQLPNCYIEHDFDFNLIFNKRNYKELINIYGEYEKNSITIPSEYEELFAQSFNYEGVKFSKAGYTDSAIFYYQKSIEIKPDFFYGWNNLGLKYLDNKEWTNAVFHYEKALQIDSISKDAAVAYSNIAFCYLYIQEFTKAEYAAKKALENYRYAESVKYANLSLARAYLFQGKYEEAKKIYLKYKNLKMSETETGKEASLRQLKTMEEAGVIPLESMEDVDKIRELLNE